MSTADRSATVLLADDHDATKAGIRLALEGQPFAIVAEVSTADAAVSEAVAHHPDLCLLDLYMPGGGIEATRRIHFEVPESKIVVLTVSTSEDDVIAALMAGASGYLLKDISAERLPAALQGILKGEAAVPRALGRRLLEELRARSSSGWEGPRFARRQRDRPELTAREWEVLQLVAERLSTSAVGQRLGISEITVRRHISSIMHKLGVHSRASAVRLLSGQSDPREQ
jgi:two-component system nitrate/nitrite response regulator NarL